MAPTAAKEETKMRHLLTRGGNPAANQVVEENRRMAIFYSYGTKIATVHKSTGGTTLNGEWWDYSATTRRYFWQFCRETNSELDRLGTQELRKIQEQYQV